jgi:hypothetical protein
VTVDAHAVTSLLDDSLWRLDLAPVDLAVAADLGHPRADGARRQLGHSAEVC